MACIILLLDIMLYDDSCIRLEWFWSRLTVVRMSSPTLLVTCSVLGCDNMIIFVNVGFEQNYSMELHSLCY